MITSHLNVSGNVVDLHAIRNIPSENSKVYIHDPAAMSAVSLPNADSVTNKIDDILRLQNRSTQPFYCVTFIGYSGLGYHDPEGLNKALKSELEKCQSEHPDTHMIIVCGGTLSGIGAVYNVVNENASLKEQIKCIGIVSECAPESELAQDNVSIIRVPDPNNTWQTKKNDGDMEYQYMLYPAHKYGGEVIAFGAGQIGYEEITEAKKIGIKTTLFPSEPDKNNLQQKMNAGKQYSDLCPLNYYEFLSGK